MPRLLPANPGLVGGEGAPDRLTPYATDISD